MYNYSGYPGSWSFERLAGPLADNGSLSVSFAMTFFFLLALCAVPLYIAITGGRSGERASALRPLPFPRTHGSMVEEDIERERRLDRAA